VPRPMELHLRVQGERTGSLIGDVTFILFYYSHFLWSFIRWLETSCCPHNILHLPSHHTLALTYCNPCCTSVNSIPVVSCVGVDRRSDDASLHRPQTIFDSDGEWKARSKSVLDQRRRMHEQSGDFFLERSDTVKITSRQAPMQGTPPSNGFR
jgi:hypothetical protein